MADPDTFRVSPSLQPLPRVEAPSVESATPSMLVRAGQTITRAGGVAGAIYTDVLKEQNAARVTEGLTSLTEYQHELTYSDGGWATQQGKNALERPDDRPLDEEVGSRFDERVQSIALGLGNDAQRRMFQERAATMSTDLRGRVQAHVADQSVKYQQQVLTGVITTGQRLMGTASDPLDMARAEETTRQAAEKLADMQGLADEARDTFFREMLTPGHMGAISRMQAAEDLDGAEAYFNQHREDLTYDATVKIEGALLEQRSIMEGGEIGEAIAGMGAAKNADAAPQSVGMPVYGNYRTTGNFGEGRGDHNHGGVDWAMSAGTPVYAGASGVARVKRDPDGYGLYVDLELDDGTTLRMGHLSATDVEDGQRVGKGDRIARSGNSGRSTGPHLHYEVIGADGVKHNPVTWHQGNPRAATGETGVSLSDQLAQLYELNLPPRQEQEAERKIRSIHGARRDAQAEERDEITSRAYAEVDRTGTLSPATRAALVGADLGSAIPSLRSFETATQARRSGQTIGDEDGLIAYGTARQMIAEGKVTSVEDLLPMKPYLPDKYYKSLVDAVTSNAQDARQEADSVIGMMNEEIAGTGLFVDEDGKQTAETKRKYAQFVGAVSRQIEVESANGPVNAQRQREIVLGMLGKTTVSALGVEVRDYQVRGYYDRIPASSRAQLTRSLQRQGIPVPSQSQVVSAWLRQNGQGQ